jgi:hypothetical protein
MKALIPLFILLCATTASLCQSPFSTEEALKQLYHKYDPAKGTAQWVCTNEQQAKEPDRLCQYLQDGNIKDDTTVSVSVILTAQVPEGEVSRIYLATSVIPARFPGEFDCHACVPATGAAVFVWQGQRWVLESANVAADYLGGWGEPPRVDLITIGPQKHGLLLSWTDMAQGFVSSSKVLLAPLGKSVEEVWDLSDEDDNMNAIDPNDKLLSMPACRASAAFRFLAGDEAISDKSDYYDIEVISRGLSFLDYDHPATRENWTEVYTFSDGKYRLSHRKTFVEVKNPGKAAAR